MKGISLVNQDNLNNIDDENINIVELQWLEHLWNHKNMFETGIVRANECLVGIYFRCFKHEGILCDVIRIASSRRF